MTPRGALGAFPRGASAALSAPLTLGGVALRPANAADHSFLLALYAGFRAAEMALVMWSPEQQQAFLADQFRLQHQHFTRSFAQADFWIVMRHDRPIGRLYLDRSAAAWHIIDIGLIVAERGKSIGRSLIDSIQRAAVAQGAEAVGLQVAINNPRARALYERLGFVASGPLAHHHQPMIWRQLNTA